MRSAFEPLSVASQRGVSMKTLERVTLIQHPVVVTQVADCPEGKDILAVKRGVSLF